MVVSIPQQPPSKAGDLQGWNKRTSQTINSLEENVADEMDNEKNNFNFEMSGQHVRKNDYEQRNNANLENVKSARKEGRKRKRPIELLN